MEQRGGKRHFRPTNGPSITDRVPAKREAALGALAGNLRQIAKWGQDAFKNGARGLTFPSRKR